MNTQEKIFQNLREIENDLFAMKAEVIARGTSPTPDHDSQGAPGPLGIPTPSLAMILDKTERCKKNMLELFRVLDRYGYKN